MAMQTRQDINFQGIFKKLGHNLDEIRVRSLENLLSKLEHNLVCDSDLINERHLMIRLIEWFNFPSPPKQGEVLHLIQRLSKHSATAQILQDIGAIEFLSQLRADVSKSLQPVIDEILENTMRLPEVPEETYAPTCVYQKQESKALATSDVASEMDPLHSSVSSVLPQESTGQPHIITGREITDGYFKDKVHVIQEQQRENTDGTSNTFLVTTFPWLALTPTDRHVIQSTNSSLQSRESHLLASSCEFLSDVVFQDFPSEIFLQRPNIVRNLLALLGAVPNVNTHLTIHAAKTLGHLTSSLRSRLRYYQDPALFTSKQDFSSASSSPFSNSPSVLSNQSGRSDGHSPRTGWGDTRPRGDGREVDSSSSVSSNSRNSSVSVGPEVTNPEETDIDDMRSLQSMQITLPQYCSLVIEKAVPLLKTETEGVVTQLMYLLNQVLEIFNGIVTMEIWQDTSSRAREIAERICGTFEALSDVINYHHHGDVNRGNTSHEKEKGDIVQHRLAFIGVTGFTARLLRQLVPLQQGRKLLPSSLIKSMELVVFDEALSHSYPSIQITLLAYLQILSPDKYKLFVDTAKISQSIQKSCQFLMLCQEEGYKGSSELINMAETSLQSLPYHIHLPLVTEFVKLSSSICARTTEERALQTKCMDILLKFLSHPLPQVKEQTYSTIKQVVKGSLNVNEAADPSSRACYLSRFLFNSDVMYQVIVFGLIDDNSKVSQMGTEIICHILDGQLLMTEDLWKEAQTSLMRSLPVLQTYVDLGTKLGSSLLAMTDPTEGQTEGGLVYLEKLRGCIRMMFSTDIRTRAEALKRLAWFLSNERDSNEKLPIFASLDVTNLTSIFVVELQRSLDEDLGRSVFQIDGLRKVYEIFNSSSVDPSVKKSAVDQLAIILQDHNLHAPFKAEGGVETILKHLKLGLVRNDNVQSENLHYLPACAAILRSLVHYDYRLRHKFARDQEMYLILLRVAFLHQRDERTCYEVAHILTLLLFDEVAKFDLGGGTSPVVHFSVPSVLRKRCRLPFRPVCHHDNSPHEVELPPDPDPIQTERSLEMLRVCWNVSWHGGMEKLQKYLARNNSTSKSDLFSEFSPRLQLSCIEKKIVQCSHLSEGIKQTLYNICNATSHNAVRSALSQLLSYLVNSYGYEGSEVMFDQEWLSSIGRFLKVHPSMPDDESLLQEVLGFISMALRLTSDVSEGTLQALGEALYQPTGPLIGLSHRTSVRGETRDVPENVNIKRTLDKELLSFISNYNCKLPYVLCRRLKFQQLRGDLCHQLLQRLNVTDAPHFYNLASLEGTLLCLMHITARPGWSTESTELECGTLCNQLLGCLLEVVSAFHIGRGGTSMSYMGKGVTKAATLCLRHLAYEMSTAVGNKKWAEQWMYVQQRADGQNSTEREGEHGLDWLLTLWFYRDPEVRVAGLGIGVALTSTEIGRTVVTSNCKHIPGGVWGMAFSILLDQLECSMVRQQAALLLVNMTSQSMPCESVELEQNLWQGPIVTDTESKVSLVGLTALLALLHHSHFYQEMLMVFTNFYAQPVIQQISAAEVMLSSQLSSASSESTMSTTADLTSVSQQGQQFWSRGGTDAWGSLKASTRNVQTVQQADSSGSTLMAGDGGSDIISVATPSLVASISQLLRNLVILAPQDTFTCLKQDSFVQILTNMVDTNLLEAYMLEMEGNVNYDQYEVVFGDLLEMYRSVISLLTACVVYDTPTRQEILANKDFIISALALMTIRFQGSSDVESKLQELWGAVLSFFVINLQLQGASTLAVVTESIPKIWGSFSENMCNIITKRLDYDHELFSKCLQFLSILFSEEGKLQGRQPDLSVCSIRELLDSGTGNDEKCENSPGYHLCKSLIPVYEQSVVRSSDHRSMERLHAASALRNLLAVSQSAKSVALEIGFVETTIENIKQLHSKMNLEALQLGKSTAKKKEDSLVQDLIITFDVLRNLLFMNEDAKMACYHSCLPSVIHKIWPWCQMEPQLMLSTVSLLSTYAAKCLTATSSLAYTSPSSTSTTQNVRSTSQQLGTNSIIHCLLKLAGKEGIREPLLKALYGLLATLCLSSECRNIMFKSNFFKEFTELNPKKKKKNKQHKNLETYWLELMVNLSFSTEGQQMILKTGDSVDLLLDFVDCGNGVTLEYSVLIIRNMCCHCSSKPKLLANDKLLPLLLSCLNKDSVKVQTIAASAFLGLVFNNQKAKVMMKNANLLPKLQETLSNLNNMRMTPEKCVQDLMSVVLAVSE
ncbi:rotatin-like isoform X2 [Ostrea edulis]|uniref:rotatin-like isoform X2 n=1 Tax=Ostrea edulis TaxID=37623 RepID=UPI0024AEE3EE|nr:rotatin-like isoform X2 [Ostrea edulis]